MTTSPRLLLCGQIFLSCFLLIAATCDPNDLNQYKPNPGAQDQFIRNIPEFLQSHAVTTAKIQELSLKKTHVPLANGAPLPFSLSELCDKTAFALYPNAQDPKAIKGYWLNTNKNITVPPGSKNGVNFIFTGELQGCSLYTQYNAKDKSLTVFHHYRKNDEPLVKKPGLGYQVKGQSGYFQDVLTWEAYGMDEGSHKKCVEWEGLRASGKVKPDDRSHPCMFTTPFLWFSTGTDRWYFVYQRIEYVNFRDPKDFRVKGLPVVRPVSRDPPKK